MPPTRGARCVLRTSPWDHPASALAAGFVEARPLLRAVHLLVPVEAGDDALISFTVPVAEPPPPQYFVRLVSERWLGAARAELASQCEVRWPLLRGT